MNKKILLIALSFVLVLILSNLASAVIFDVKASRQEEWEMYKAYRQDYIETNNLEAYSKYIYEPNLMHNFGFYSPSYYYIPPQVLAAKYNPPLQGDVYYTENRGYTSSLSQPSAVKYYADKTNGRYTGYVPSTLNGVYFDHPDSNNAYGYLTVNSRYTNYGYNYGYNHRYNYGYDNYDYGLDNARFYARVAEPLGNGFYLIGYQ
ncbi:hypothetical protein JW756_04335 [Candidatus Woesearchaeota archaeon]|nr:hypothetical protein [Candidatus Woesearchaeota archaeon]